MSMKASYPLLKKTQGERSKVSFCQVPELSTCSWVEFPEKIIHLKMSPYYA